MSQTEGDGRQVKKLLISLFALILIILIVVISIVSYPTLFKSLGQGGINSSLTPLSSNTATLFTTLTPTPSASSTLRPTSTPTITLTPTSTIEPSPTITPPGPATLVPFQPIKGDTYKLIEWTDNESDYMVALMNDYPNTLSESARGENYENYYNAYFYASIAQKESLLRFPESPLADNWNWGLAYNLAQIGDPGAGEQYNQLIVDGLNQGDTDLENLSNWFSMNEPRLNIYIIGLEALDGYLASYLLNIRGGGSAYILLLQSTGGYSGYVLAELFDFVNDPQSRSLVSDVTGDEFEEIGVYTLKPIDSFLAERPALLQLSDLPPLELYFRPSVPEFDVGMEFTNFWGVTEIPGGSKELYFETETYPACPATIKQIFHWDGNFFDIQDTEYRFSPNPSSLSYCEYLVDHAVNTWGYPPAIQLMEQLLPDWPPDYDQNGDPYPADAGDEWRYKLGVYNAQIGNYESAVEYFQEVINSPTDPLSKWVREASVFLANYKSAGDVYTACIQVDECNPSDALDFILNQAGRDPSQDAFEYLYQEDVPLRATGFFDFELDDIKERWFTVQHRPLEQLELWILATSRSGDVGFYISPVNANKPTFSYLDEDSKPPIVYVSNELAIRLNRDPDTFYPYIEFPVVEIIYTDPFVEGMNQARDELLSGGDPDTVIKMLKNLAVYPGLLCQATQTCDPYYYYLGLAYELAGKTNLAVETYLYLWQNYILSPFTSMARLKMIGTITPTPPTPTAVATPSTLTPTPPVSVTATPTGGIIYPTPTITNTFPPPVYPYPRP